MNANPLMAAELAQARNAATKMASDRELYVRLVAVLARAVSGKAQVGEQDDKIIVKKSDFDEVPNLWVIGVTPGTMKAESGDASEPDVDILVVSVTPRSEPSKLVIARSS